MRLEEVARQRRLARMRLLAEQGEMRRQEARALRWRSGDREAKGRRRRGRRGREGQRKRARAGGQGPGCKRWRATVLSDSDSDSEGDGDGVSPAGGHLQRRLVAGRLVAGRKRKRIDESDSDDGGATAGGPDGERHQAAVAEARWHLGGGEKRGWVE